MSEPNFKARFTDQGQRTIILAREEAERHQNDYLGTEHLVLAILRQSDGVALAVIKKMGLSPEQVRLEIERNLPSSGDFVTYGEMPFTPRVKKVIEFSFEETKRLGRNYTGSEHLLLGLLREEEGQGGKVLRTLGANLLTARQLVSDLAKTGAAQQERPSDPTVGPPSWPPQIVEELAKRVADQLAPRIVNDLAPLIVKALSPRTKKQKKR